MMMTHERQEDDEDFVESADGQLVIKRQKKDIVPAQQTVRHLLTLSPFAFLNLRFCRDPLSSNGFLLSKLQSCC